MVITHIFMKLIKNLLIESNNFTRGLFFQRYNLKIHFSLTLLSNISISFLKSLMTMNFRA